MSALIKPSDCVQAGNESLPSQVPWHTTEDQDLYHAADLPLRSEMLAVQDRMLWPPLLDSVCEDVAMDLVPSSVRNVLAWIVDNDERTQQDVPVIFLYSPTLTRRLTPSVAVGDSEGT